MNQYLKDIFKIPLLGKITPSPLRLTLTIYSLVVLYRVNNKNDAIEIDLLEIIIVSLFPAFFLGYIATVSPEYLNIFQPESTITGKKIELGFFNEIKNLSKDKRRLLLIFIPIYVLATYQLNKKLIHKLYNYFASKF